MPNTTVIPRLTVDEIPTALREAVAAARDQSTVRPYEMNQAQVDLFRKWADGFLSASLDSPCVDTEKVIDPISAWRTNESLAVKAAYYWLLARLRALPETATPELTARFLGEDGEFTGVDSVVLQAPASVEPIIAADVHLAKLRQRLSSGSR
jgi:hypothetical protein